MQSYLGVVNHTACAPLPVQGGIARGEEEGNWSLCNIFACLPSSSEREILLVSF